MSGKLDLKSIVIAQMHYEELGRAFKELLEHIEPERFEWKLDDKGEFEHPADVDEFEAMRFDINVKDISKMVGDFKRKREDAVLLRYPDYLVPLLKCLERQSIALQTLQGAVGPRHARAKLSW